MVMTIIIKMKTIAKGQRAQEVTFEFEVRSLQLHKDRTVVAKK